MKVSLGSSALLCGLCLVASMACTALPETPRKSAQTWQARIKAVEDSICSVTNLVVLDAKTGLVRVDFVLRAEPESDIRCRVELPSPENWDGRLWGVGNSSLGGFIPKLHAYTAMGAAAVTTDIGTWAMVAGKRDFDTWPLAVRRDYSWRSTHLMTIYGKRMVEAYYGKAPRKSYFHGGSCGGRQAFSEAIRYPADYDGIVTHLPANNFVANKFNAWLVYHYTRDENENLVFTTNEMRTVADAAVEYRTASDPKPYAGHFLADGRATPEEVDAMLALAAKKMPSLLEGDKLARLKALYTPFCVDGKCLTTGFAPGTYLGQRMNRTAAKRWQSVMEFAERDGDWYNANTADLTPFFERGGRMMILAGWEDQTISPLPIVDHYERICAFEGGLEKAMEHCRLFCAPGVAHGGGKGRATQGGVGKVGATYGRKAIVRWVEEGVAPDRIVVEDKPRGTTFPVATYPGLFIQNDKGEWTREERPRTKPTLADITFMCNRTPPGAVVPCAVGAPRAAKEAPLVMQNVAHRGIWKNRNIPENTVESIKLAYDSGATWVETDFYVTKAGQFICIHGSRELKKYAGVEKKIADLTPEDIATINLGAKLKTDKVFRIPLLHQVLDVVPKHGVLQAEIKGYTKDYAVRFDKAVKEAGLSETNIMVSSFHYDALKDFKQCCPKYRTLWLTTIPKDKQFADVMQEQIEKCKAAKFDILCPGGMFAGRIKTEEADAVRAAGLDFRLWGVNSEEELRQAKRLKASGFTCNYWREAFGWAEKIGGITLLPTSAYDVRSFGAVGDGRTKDTAALQRALDACAKTGGRVTVPPGTYLTGSLFLGDNTELHLQEGATLLGSPDLADYNADDAYPQNFCSPREGWSAKHLILAIERRNVSITGRGTIDGNGRTFLEDKPSRVGTICWRDGCCEVRGGRKNMGRPGQEIVFIECEGVSVRDVTFRDMSCWSCLFYGCANVTVGGVTVRNNIRGFNTDGFDIDSCRNVTIGDCDITTGDDAIAIRGAPGNLKDKTKICENVRVSNIVCRVSSSGVRVGVGSGAIRDVKVSNMKIERAGRGIHVQCCYVKSKGKVEVRGVDISDVTFERISIRDAASAVLVVAGYPSSRARLENIRFDHIDAEFFSPCFVAGNGTTRVHGVEFSDCAFKMVRAPCKVPSDSEAGMLSCDRNGAFRIQQADGVAFRRCSLAWDADAEPELTKAFAIHDAPQPLVDAESSLKDR